MEPSWGVTGRPLALGSPGSLEIMAAVAKIGSSFQNIVREHY